LESISDQIIFDVLLAKRFCNPIDCHAEVRGIYTIIAMFYNNRQYYVYILTNYQKTVLYTGVTNNLEQRVIEHYLDKETPKPSLENTIAFFLFIMNALNISIMQF